MSTVGTGRNGKKSLWDFFEWDAAGAKVERFNFYGKKRRVFIGGIVFMGDFKGVLEYRRHLIPAPP